MSGLAPRAARLVAPLDGASRTATHRPAPGTGLGIDPAWLAVSGSHRYHPTLRSAHRYRRPPRSRTDTPAGMEQCDRAGRKQAGLAAGCNDTRTATTSVLDSP